KPNIVLRGLSSNTEYVARVTGVDMEEAETTPSNEFKFLTKNVPPERPGNLIKHQQPGGATVISWDAAVDGDGKVTGYRLYAKVKGKRALVGETGKTTYSVQDAPRYKRVEVTAVDERGDESAGAGILLVPPTMAITFSPGIIYSLGTLGEMGALGYGGLVSFMVYNVIMKGLSPGLEVGYFYMQGENVLESEGQRVDRFQVIPFALKLGYTIKLVEHLDLVPAISMGGAYVDIAYVSRDQFSLADTNKESKGTDILGMISVALEWSCSEELFLGARAGYGMLLEKDERLSLTMLGVYWGMRF
nr:hypothetical protein [Spirochaetota bacterium]